MVRKYKCKHCGDDFSPRPGKPGFVDECEPCVLERAPKNVPAPPRVVKSRTVPVSVRAIARELGKPLKTVVSLIKRKRKLGWATDLDWLNSKKQRVSLKCAEEIRKYYAENKLKKAKNLSAIPILAEIAGLQKLLANPKTPKQLKPSKQKRLDLLLAQVEAATPKPEAVPVVPRPMSDLELEIWLSTLRRTLVRFVNELDPQSALSEKVLELGLRVSNLCAARVMPRNVGEAILFINATRNKMEYRGVRPDTDTLMRVTSGWKMVEQYAKRENSKLVRDMEVLQPSEWREYLLKVLTNG